jgi:hypothetical protein
VVIVPDEKSPLPTHCHLTSLCEIQGGVEIIQGSQARESCQISGSVENPQAEIDFIEANYGSLNLSP